MSRRKTKTNMSTNNVKLFDLLWDNCNRRERDAIRRRINRGKVKAETKENAKIVLDFLNRKSGKNFRAVDTNIDLIAARLSSGATIEDCKAIIAKQARQWLGTDREIYLRPATLFNKTKFEQYIGSVGNGSQTQ